MSFYINQITIMKKIFLLPIFILTFVSFSSCEKDESLDPRPLFVSGQFMRLDIKRDRLNVNDPNTSFGGPLTNPSNTVVRYELFVRLTRGGVVQSDIYLMMCLLLFRKN